MGKKFLYEVLREDQEPFALQTLRGERRCQRPPPSPAASSSLQRNRSASLAQLRSGSVKRRPLLSCLALLRNPFSSSASSAGRWREMRTLSWNGRDEDPQPFLHEPHKRGKRKKIKDGRNEERSPARRRGRWGVAAFLAKKLFPRKRDGAREVGLAGCEEGTGAVEAAGSLPLSCLDAEEAEEAAAEEASELGEVTTVRSSTSLDEADPGSPATPGSSATEPSRGAQLFCGDREAPLGRQDKEQSSPVSVLDPPFHEDEDGRPRGKSAAVEHGDDEEEEQGQFHLRLATLDRTREELVHRIARFENIVADLGPVAARCRLELDDGASTGRAIRRRLEFWNPAKSEAARQMVETDLRRGWEAWRWRSDQAPELAAEVSRALFAVLVNDLAMELCA